MPGQAPSPLIYSSVSRGVVSLASYTAFTGNFTTIAEQCLHKLPLNKNDRHSYVCDYHVFNFLVEDGFVYLVVSDESLGRQIPMAFLDRVKEDFRMRYGTEKINTAPAHSLDLEYGPKLKQHMQYCIDHRDDLNKLSKVKAQVAEVKGIMMDNIEKVLERGEKIEMLVDKTDNLRSQAQSFQKQGRQLRRSLCLQNMKMKLIVLGIVVVVILIIWILICRGFTCH